MAIPVIPLIVRWLSRRALRWCYREVHYMGRRHMPEVRAAFLFGNHPNDLPDVLAGFFVTPRPVRYVATISATTLPLATATYRGLGVIPVTRVRDVRKMRASGIDLREVNRDAFTAVRSALASGEVVGAFPEGGVHDSPFLARFHSGVAKMALNGVDTGADDDVVMVPFGIQYEAPRTPRSDVVVEIGASQSLREWVATRHQASEAVSASALAHDMHDRLTAVTRNSVTWGDAEVRDRLVAAVAALSARAGEPILVTAARVQRRCSARWWSRPRRRGRTTIQPPGARSRSRWRKPSHTRAGFPPRRGTLPDCWMRRVSPIRRRNGRRLGWMLIAAIPAMLGLVLLGPIMRAVWWLGRETATVRTDYMARAILPGLHLILLWHLVVGASFALGFRALSLSGWWAIPVVWLLPRLGDVGLTWRDALRARRLRYRVQTRPAAEREAIHVAAAKLRAAWAALSISSE
jgi:1-acyl-sn-glycerol-3-phosphate acyltransferase